MSQVLIVSVPVGLLGVLTLLLPGLIWAWWCYPSPSATARLSVGSALGVAFQMNVAALLAAGPGISRVSVAVSTSIAVIAAGVLAVLSRRPRIPRLAATRRSRQALQLGALLTGATLVRLLPLTVDQLPQGGDPAYHVLLASTTINTGRLPTWAPFEPIPSNYPYGSHVLTAMLALLTGIAPTAAFEVLLDGALPLLTGLSLYVLARRVLHGHAPALAAVVAYGFLGIWGSIDYGAWGGLPNATGFFLLLALCIVLFTPRFTLTRLIVGGLLCGAIPLAHHQVMLTGAFLLIAYALYLGWRWLVSRASPVERRSARNSLFLLIEIAVIAGISVSYYALPEALHIANLQGTGVLRALDPSPGWVLPRNGVALWVLALAGAPLVTRFAGRDGRGIGGRARVFVTLASVTLLLALLTFYYGYLLYTKHRYGQPYTALAASRFLTDLTYFLAIYAGQPLLALWRWSDVRRLGELGEKVSVSILSRLARAGLRVSLIVGVVGLGLNYVSPQVLPEPSGYIPRELAAGEGAALNWIKTSTPSNTLVFNLNHNPDWAPYFTQREVWVTSLPASEFSVGYVAEKRYLGAVLLDLLAQGQQAQVMASASAGTALSALVGRPVVLVTDHAVPGLNGSPLFTSGPERVYALPDGFASLLAASHQATPTFALAGPHAASGSTSGAPMVAWWPSVSKGPPPGWRDLGFTAAAWARSVPHITPRGGTAYVLMTLPGAVPAAAVTCRAEGQVSLSVDGRMEAGACSGNWVSLPELASAGPHVVAASGPLGSGPGPWLDVILAQGMQTSR
jgi:Family of unknown function (DUF6541)